jgi:probable HAF family extracellular repeat protein
MARDKRIAITSQRKEEKVSQNDYRFNAHLSPFSIRLACLARLCGLLGLVLPHCSAQQILYKVVDLGTLGGTTSVVNGQGGINASGFVAGISNIASGLNHAFFYDGSIHDLGTIAGGSTSTSNGLGLNNAGIIVGSTIIHRPINDPPSEKYIQAFIDMGRLMINIGTLGGIESVATAINESNQVVGSSTLSNEPQPYHAFLFSGGSMIDLGSLGGSSEAFGINQSGKVVGGSYLPDGTTFHGFLWNAGVMSDLGTLGGTLSQAFGINSNDAIVGVASLPGDTKMHAALWNAGQITDLGSLNGQNTVAHGINDDGVIVGTAAFPAGGPSADEHAFIYANESMTDLNTLIASDSGWVLEEAEGINSAVQIIGNGPIGGQIHAFRLDPQ